MDALDSLWPYRFVTLTPEQTQERRNVLTLRAQYAQLSTLLVLILVSVHARLSKTKRNVSKEQKKNQPKPWLDHPPVAGWGETRRQYLVMSIWLVWMVALSVWRTGDDYLHLARSIGHTIFALMPFEIFLSPKLSSQHPLLRLSGLSQAALTPYHRLFGRLVIFPLLTLHAMLYMMFFALTTEPVPLLPKRLNDLDVQLGITGISLAFVLWITSSSWRAWGGLKKKVSRETFYAVHVSLVLGFFVVAYFHVEYARKYVLQALAVYAIDIVAAEVEKARL
ncbi:hypothetical protein VTO42DRAFT_60 [Malbranchea cinnamomea]